MGPKEFLLVSFSKRVAYFSLSPTLLWQGRYTLRLVAVVQNEDHGGVGKVVSISFIT